MSGNLLVVLDSASDDIVYEGGSHGRWTTKSGIQWYDNSSAWSGTTPGSIHVTFTGNTIAFYGDSPPLQYSQEMTVTIDEQEPFETNFVADHAGSYCQWWQSPTLDDGMHNILLEGLARTSLDFAVVTVNHTLVKSGQQVIVDDDDASIVYKGDWVRNTSPFTSNNGMPVSFPFHNATHQSNTIGSSVSFNFTGSHIAVYGSLPARANGSITARYTLNSHVIVKKYELVVNPSQNNVVARQRLLFYSNISLNTGNHTLLIEIEDVQSLTYSLDYVVYTHCLPETISPQVETASAPPISRTASLPVSIISSTSSNIITSVSPSFSLPSSSSSTSSSKDSTTEIPTITFNTTPLILTSTPGSASDSITNASATPTTAAGSIKTSVRIGEIVGIAAGSTVILVVLVAAILYCKRRRNRRRFVLLQDIGSTSSFGKSVESRSLTPVEPFTLSHPAPGSRAAIDIDTSELKSSNLLRLNRNLDFVQFSTLHRRSGSGPRSGDTNFPEDTYYTMTTSSPTISVDGKPPSYKF